MTAVMCITLLAPITLLDNMQPPVTGKRGLAGKFPRTRPTFIRAFPRMYPFFLLIIVCHSIDKFILLGKYGWKLVCIPMCG